MAREHQIYLEERKRRLPVGKVILYLILIIGALCSLFPFYWMFVMATNPTHLIASIPPAVIPGSHTVENFKNVLSRIDFFGSMLNSLIVSVATTVGQLFLCSLAGFAFAKIRFPGKKVIFAIVLGTMMVPKQLSLIPSYIVVAKWLGWLGKLHSVIVPYLVGAFGIFWMNQYIKEAIHDELIDSAKIDGCSNFRTYFNIVIPNILPAFATLGIIVFMQIWNDFMWPMVMLPQLDHTTIQVALRNLNDLHASDYGMIMSGVFWATAPLIVIFLSFNRLFIESLTQGAIKG